MQLLHSHKKNSLKTQREIVPSFHLFSLNQGINCVSFPASSVVGNRFWHEITLRLLPCYCAMYHTGYQFSKHQLARINQKSSSSNSLCHLYYQDEQGALRKDTRQPLQQGARQQQLSRELSLQQELLHAFPLLVVDFSR